MKKEKRDMQDRKDMIGFFFYLTLVILILHEVYLPRIGIGGIFDELLDVLVLLIFCGFCIKMLIKEKTRVKKSFCLYCVLRMPMRGSVSWYCHYCRYKGWAGYGYFYANRNKEFPRSPVYILLPVRNWR